MVDTSQIRNGLAVIASDAEPVGAVDSVEGDRLKLTRKDSTDDIHHYIPLAWVERVEERIHLNRTGAEVRASWGHGRAGAAASALDPGGAAAGVVRRGVDSRGAASPDGLRPRATGSGA